MFNKDNTIHTQFSRFVGRKILTVELPRKTVGLSSTGKQPISLLAEVFFYGHMTVHTIK